jgi:hypothetical protein
MLTSVLLADLMMDWLLLEVDQNSHRTGALAAFARIQGLVFVLLHLALFCFVTIPFV